ncbi:MAG: hypothetical protein ACLGIC_05860 [Acidimicrobiia bacterium]
MRMVVVAAALLLVACADEPTAAEARERLVADLAADLEAAAEGELDAVSARCVAERLADDVGVERFEDAVAADDALRDEVLDAFAACDALDPLAGG